ncbi:MAG: (2Fe-2S)-binding protein [Pirellulales bacterium]|nr:(2Fe-2S)-binding protein [Pirellulales bacterium]
MTKITIDNRELEVPAGTTVLGAARQLGIEIPSLCYREGCDASASCLVCVVKINGNARLAPACATAVEEGMMIESETAEVHAARRTALELLLSDHLGDCLAPCFFSCPAEMDIPVMLRQIAAGDLRGAIATVKRDIALPAVLGRICPAPCEKACRRRELDGAVAICLLKRFVADVDLATAEPYLPVCETASGRKVAILGGGPTGLAAAYYLARAGYACTILDENAELGGRLLRETTPEELPREVLAAEIAQIARLGMEVQLNRKINAAAFNDLCGRFDAVLIAAGHAAREQADAFGVAATTKGIHVEHGIFRTDRPKVFAAGTAVRGKSMVVRSAADGKEAAAAIDQFLRGATVTGQIRPFTTKIGRMEGEELLRFAEGAAPDTREEPTGGLAEGYVPDEAASQAVRCLHCDCRGLHACKLRKYSAIYGADPKRFKGHRRAFVQDAQHAEVLFEPGKCIDCGLCIQIAAKAGEEIGLTFVGRGFDVRVAVPLDRHLGEALQKVAAECVAACPTAALAWKASRGVDLAD